MKPLEKDFIKEILGEIPLSAELYWVLRRPMHGLKTRYRLDELEKRLPQMVEEAAAAGPVQARRAQGGDLYHVASLGSPYNGAGDCPGWPGL